MPPTDDPDFGAKERDLIRREFMQRMSSARSIHDGFLLRRWSTGERKGQPKVPAAVQSMLDRGLVALDDLDKHWPVARFTTAGFRALRRMAADRRAFTPESHARLLEEVAALTGVDDDA
ncbi:hypothetical protein GAY30_12870 [Azospirillum brasilense]|uniref:hypothetical protein n=1 Tax=Azospirillum brasilense TaxID=192 RepID=UPI00157A7346|nr:hypothetical protein [Azospirillum brasilense]NUB25777.1 hypothetical protein [Azospirillum brasilense]NUB31481.1 hypothetical protein [Azospirillum brasilense]